MIASLILLMIARYLPSQMPAQLALQKIPDAVAPDCKHHSSGMDKEMREAVTDAHNTLRYLIAIGNITRHSRTNETFPEAANMRFMEYGCKFESRAARLNLCEKIPPRKTFNYTDRNYRYIQYLGYRTGLDALILAVHEWWDTHLYNHGFEGLAPRHKDFPTIPFFQKPKVGNISLIN
ncbi:hypothetical protein TELCIR_06146 [Teladorsagia circumcincta]|uniref:SCP domain-containing protein n=1 Tax=Teladorsagia circumcincta TaxID=45464 RepID=A0A2G9UQD7_TELCI|nr:hypothetical protein TELCIR_06146 [Teladorsagia circumcincta]